MQTTFVLAVLSAVMSAAPPAAPEIIRELHKGPAGLSDYIIEPPDILRIAVKKLSSRSEFASQLRGEHLVRPDGTIGLGAFGCLYVAGLTAEKAKVAIERHLSGVGVKAKISVQVSAPASKFYYVILKDKENGEQVFRFLIAGNDTVLDTLAQVPGFPEIASNKRVWVSRPAPGEEGGTKVLPVDWKGIVRQGSAATNYPICPGDRIYVGQGPFRGVNRSRGSD